MIGIIDEPGFYITYAVVQAVVLLLLIRFLDLYERQPLSLLALMAFWGATGAPLIALAGNRAVKGMLSGEAKTVFGDAVSAPLVEEGAKGLALVLAIGPLRWLAGRLGVFVFEGLTAGIVYGAAVGVGFAFTEDVYFFFDRARNEGFESGLDFFVYRRDFFGPAMLHHPLFTAAFGAGLGLAAWSVRRWARIVLPLLGLAVAIAMHAVNNGLVELVLALGYGLGDAAAWSSGAAVTASVEDTASAIIVVLKLLDYVYIAVFLGATALWLRYQRRIIRTEVAEEAASGLVSPAEAEQVYRAWPRTLRYWRLVRSGQLEQWRHLSRLHGALVRLALLKWRTRRFGGDPARVQRARRAIATLAAFEPTPGNLPRPATPMVGRQQELQAVLAQLARSDTRLVTLTGPGGTGKTRLALEAATKARERFASGAFFVPLAPIRDPSLVPAAIAEVLGVAQREGESPLESLKDYLRDKHLLLFLDNFEQLTGAAAALGDLLGAAPRVRAIATSREALRVAGEHEFAVPPLPEPGAVELFDQRARAVDPDFRVTDENREAVTEIGRRLDGLPLAIELTAARVRLLSPAEILTRLEAPTEASPLRETISWSYELLDADEQALLGRLAVFVGGCRLRAAEFVCGDGVVDIVEGVASLAEKSLVRRSVGVAAESRVEMLETIREFARERLDERGDAAALRHRHAEHLVALAERAEPALTSPEQAYWLARLSEENANIRAALTWSNKTGEFELGLRLAGALVRFWSARGLMAEGRQWLEQALARADDVVPATLAKAEFAAGYAALGLGDFPGARGHFEHCLALARDLGDERLEGATLAQLAWLAMATGRADEARTNAENALRLARAADDKVAASGALNVLAEMASKSGDGEATSLFEEALALRRELGDERLIANSLLLLGRVDQNEARFVEALELSRGLDDSWTTSVALLRLGEVRHDSVLVQEALVIARERGDEVLVAECEEALGRVGS